MIPRLPSLWQVLAIAVGVAVVIDISGLTVALATTTREFGVVPIFGRPTDCSNRGTVTAVIGVFLSNTMRHLTGVVGPSQEMRCTTVKTTVVAGNPKPASRTLDAATMLAETLTGQAPDAIVDVITLGPGLLGWGDEAVAEAVKTVAASDLIVVASPTFKATYTGVLKLFLDQFATGDGLRDVVAVPLMLGAGPAHALAPDLLLKPVLVELGATTPSPGLYLKDSTYTSDSRIADYSARWAPVLTAVAGTGRAGR